MAFSLIYDLFVNKGAQALDNPLVVSLADASVGTTPHWIQGDEYLLRVWLCDAQYNNGQFTGFSGGQLDAGDQIVLGSRAANATAATLLCSATGFAENRDGLGNYYYTAPLSLNTTQINAAIGSSLNGTLNLITALQVQNADNSSRKTFQFSTVMDPAVLSGSNGVPTDGNPAYPAPAALITNGADTATIKRGQVALATGSVTAAIAFATPFAAVPGTVLGHVLKANAADDNASVVSFDSLTVNGCNANLSGPAPAGAVLMWTALL